MQQNLNLHGLFPLKGGGLNRKPYLECVACPFSSGAFAAGASRQNSVDGYVYTSTVDQSGRAASPRTYTMER